MAVCKSGGQVFYYLIHKLAVSYVVVYVCIHAPLLPRVLSKDLLEFSQMEEQAAGQLVGSVSSSPIILQMTGGTIRSDLRFSILPDGNDNSNLFKMDAVSGNITLGQRVDREVVCPLSLTCELHFGVAVSGGNNFFRRIPVTVVIVDINDNSPMFQDPNIVEVRISEDSPEKFSYALPVATDADSSVEFGIHSYTIEPPSQTFRLETSRNVLGISQVSLVLSQRLDREVTSGYQFMVVAKDGGQPARSGALTVNVVVEDINDNQPRFVQKIYTAVITEDAGNGDKILTVSASDEDIGNNGKVVYSVTSLRSGNVGEIGDKVRVDASNGLVTLKAPLVNGEYRFWLDAHDLGTPRRYDQTMVKLTVLDTINNQPIVKLNPVQKDSLPLGWFPEGLEINTVVAVVSVHDPDHGHNGNVTCQTLEPDFRLENLESSRYKLMVARSLDREAAEAYTARVSCHDQGKPPLSTTASMEVKLVDINDHSPQFRQESYVFNIVENNMRKDTVAFITATDKDEGQNAVIVYTLLDDGGNFSIAPHTGLIMANKRFDREEVAQYTFLVVAVDQGDPALTSTATVTVNILDVNDNDPVFSRQEYTFQVYENTEVGSAIGHISVTDPDLADGANISLSLKPADPSDLVPFAIDRNGRISSLQRFDREDQNTYNFFVAATDNGPRKRSASAKVVVQILDTNDNAPVFIFPNEQNHTTIINMPIQKDAVLLQIDVYDADETQNGLVAYYIVDNNASELFTVGTHNGHIMSSTDFNSPDLAGAYMITINATDKGLPPLWQTRTLNLILQWESIPASEAQADHNLLIVSCIVCFTVFVSGVVLVSICVVRGQDRKKKCRYHASVFLDQPADAASDLVHGNGLRPNLQTAKTGQQSPPPRDEVPSYHQQHQQQHDRQSTYSDVAGNMSRSTETSRSATRVTVPDFHNPRSEPKTFKLQTFDTCRHRQDDFNSTTSTETGTGDSGHGSDEDISNGADHTTVSSKSDRPGASLADTSNKHRMSVPDITHRQPVQLPHPSAMKTSRLRANSCSVRFDPRVTDIHDHRHPLRTRPPEYPARGRSSSVPCSVVPQNPQLEGDIFKNGLPQPSGTQPLWHASSRLPAPYPRGDTKPMTARWVERTGLPSLSSLGDSCNEDSDLNTTTSGSYSVVSESVFRPPDLDVSYIRDIDV